MSASNRIENILDGLIAIAQKATRSDDEWVNFSLGNTSEKFKEDVEANALFLRRSTPQTCMRLVVALRKALKQRDETIIAYEFANGRDEEQADQLIEKDNKEILLLLEKQNHNEKH